MAKTFLPVKGPSTKSSSLSRRAALAFKFDGMAELQEQLGKIVNDVSGAEMKEVLLKQAIVLRDEAKRIAPKGLGNLRNSIFATRGDTNKPTAFVGVNFKIAPHAHIVEYGHAGPHPAPPHPYMRPAVVNKAEAIQRGLAEGLGAIIKKYTA